MDEASFIIEGYGAKKNNTINEITTKIRRKSEPIILLNSNNNKKEWPIIFGGTPNIDIENDENLPSRPRSRTTTIPPNGTLPLIYEKNKPTFIIGKKKKLAARRLSLPPILEGDHQTELSSSSPIMINKILPISTQENQISSTVIILSPTPPTTSQQQNQHQTQQSPISPSSGKKINSPRSNHNFIIPPYKSPIPKNSTVDNLPISPNSVAAPPLTST